MQPAGVTCPREPAKRCNRHKRQQESRAQPVRGSAMKLPECLLTERLRLRPPTEADAEQMFARYAQDAEVCRYMNWTPHQSIDDTREYLRRIVKANDVGSSADYLIFSRASCELIGSVGGRLIDTQPTLMQFGYCLARDGWGHGLATEAARAFGGAVMGEPTIWRLQAFCDVENRASARVLEKAGLAFEGTLRRYMVLPNLGDAPRDMLCYAKVRT
jgi:RimJ/RimL family protein N-acetyltransferase